MKCVERSLGEIEEAYWWRNEGVKDTIARKKVAFKGLCRFPSDENKTQYKRIRNQTRKIVARAMRMKANHELNNLYQNSNSVFYFLGRMKKEGKDVEGTDRAMPHFYTVLLILHNNDKLYHSSSEETYFQAITSTFLESYPTDSYSYCNCRFTASTSI